MRSYYPCRWKRKGCYSLVTLFGSGRFRALMYSLHWREAAEMLLVLGPVRSIYLCHWHYLLESEWHSVSPESTEKLRGKRCAGHSATVEWIARQTYKTLSRKDAVPLHLGHHGKGRSRLAKSFKMVPSLLRRVLSMKYCDDLWKSWGKLI